MMTVRQYIFYSIAAVTILSTCTWDWGTKSCAAHEQTLPAARKRQNEDRVRLLAQAKTDSSVKERLGRCHLTLELIDVQTQQALAGNLRITDDNTGHALALSGLIQRPEGWFAMSQRATVSVPQTQLSIAAFHGLETELGKTSLDLSGKEKAHVRLRLKQFYDAAHKKQWSGNTHFHLNRTSRKAADRYLQVVPKADDLDLLYVSHLKAFNDHTYITNEYTAESLAQLADNHQTLRHGQEHRHDFKDFVEGYGHVMFLDIQRLIEPVSIGPGLMHTGSDGIPLQRGIKAARSDGASVIWCHNRYGLEDLPNWMSGVLDAQNIFDGGGEHGSYEDTYYRYLNIGLTVPFSTGTDWSIYDFSRVYVPLDGPLISPAWLRQLAAGRSYITNGTLLELHVHDHDVGDTIRLADPTAVGITGSAMGRNDFRAIELIHNGQVIHTVKSHRQDGHFLATIDFSVKVDQPGWFALRIPLQTGNNEFAHPLFAHSSPIYVELRGKRIFQPQLAQQLLLEMQRSVSAIKKRGIFDNDQEKDAVLNVHRNGITALQERLKRHGQD